MKVYDSPDAVPNVVDIKVGRGVFRILEGDENYGSVHIDFIASDSQGNEVQIPVVSIESPYAKFVNKENIPDSGIEVLFYGDVWSDMFTRKDVIRYKDIKEVCLSEDVNPGWPDILSKKAEARPSLGDSGMSL